MSNLIQDLAALTTTPENTISNLADISMICICHNVYESMCKKESDTEIDIGIGKLYIRVDSNVVKYKFVPCNKLDGMVLNTLDQNCSPLTSEIESALKKRVIRTYKELF